MVLCDSIPVVNRGTTISTTPLPSEILGAAPLNCRFTTGSNMAFSDSFGDPSKFQGILIMFLGDCHIFGAASFWMWKHPDPQNLAMGLTIMEVVTQSIGEHDHQVSLQRKHGWTTFGVRLVGLSSTHIWADCSSRKRVTTNPFEPTSNYWRNQEILFKDLKLRQEIRIVFVNVANGWGLVNVHPLMILDTSYYGPNLCRKIPIFEPFYAHIKIHMKPPSSCAMPLAFQPKSTRLTDWNTVALASVRCWESGLKGIAFEGWLNLIWGCYLKHIVFRSTNASEIRLYPDPVWFPLRCLESCWYHHFGLVEQHHHLQCGGSNVAAMFVS